MAAKKAGVYVISDESVIAKTGKSWEEWFQILDAWGGLEKGHKLTARYLADEWQVSAWWAQSVTVQYEQDRGARLPGQRSGGKFAVSIQRTIQATPDEAFNALTEPAKLSRWLTTSAQADLRVGGRYSNADGDQGHFLLLERPRRMRMTWENSLHAPGTVVEVTCESKPGGRVTVRLEHAGIEDEAAFLDMKKCWSSAMDSLKSYLETGKGIPAR
jgi:uncharacterized protein YndB with AHSA1/START domain